MFFLCFVIFTLVFTIFENLLLASIFLLLILCSLAIYQYISDKRILNKKTFILIFLSFILAGISFGIKEWRYYGRWKGESKIVIGTGMISDVSSQGKYIFKYKKNEYMLYSSKEYDIGDDIRIVGKMQENNKPPGFSYRTITSGTFAIPLFSGSFDFAKWIKMKGRKGTIYEDNSLQLDVGNSRLEAIGLVKQMKRGLQEKIVQTYGKNRVSGLILGMLIGDKSHIPPGEYQDFIDSGLVHLVAVSGGNILMVIVFLQCVLFFLPFYIRLGLILLTIIGYSLVCGLDSSVFRAVLMGGMSMVALFWGREINIRRVLSISCIIMLVINPYFLAYDTGFLLSYSALIGIVYLETMKDAKQKPMEKKKNKIILGIQYVYKNYVSPSIGASIGIFPIIIFFMGKINLLGILGNVLVLPLVPFVMIYGFISVWLHMYIKWEWLLQIETFLVQYIYHISELLTNYGIFLQISGLWYKYLILLIFLGFFIYRRTKKHESST